VKHSNIVGGSTAKRVINCPGSVALVQRMPPQVENKYMAEGTALHAAIDRLINDDTDVPFSLLNKKIEGVVIDEHHVEKLEYAMGALDTIDPDRRMTYVTEVQVGFSGIPELEGVFGHTDLIGRIGDRAIVLDWKFGDGVMVEAEENPQGLFYAAAAMRTDSTQWVFKDVTEVEIVIVQPFQTRRWVTTPDRVKDFERDLVRAVKLAQTADAPLAIGDHCRFCTAKPICPQMNGAVDRLVHTALEAISPEQLGASLKLADDLEAFIGDLRALATQRLEKNMPVPGYKLVPKLARRQWVDENQAAMALADLGVASKDMHKAAELLSPAQMEKVLKKSKLALPDDLVVAVSSGNTLAPESDPRPAAVLIGQQLVAALSKLK
jgi:hypothetical protein